MESPIFKMLFVWLAMMRVTSLIVTYLINAIIRWEHYSYIISIALLQYSYIIAPYKKKNLLKNENHNISF